MAELSTRARNRLPAKEFAEPEKRAYPIEDKSHARNAKARAAQPALKRALPMASALPQQPQPMLPQPSERKHGAHGRALVRARTREPSGRQCAGSLVAAMIAIQGTSAAAARCTAKESTPTTRAALPSRYRSSPNAVRLQAEMSDASPARISSIAAESESPCPVKTMRRPGSTFCNRSTRSRHWRAGHCLRVLPAPGHDLARCFIENQNSFRVKQDGFAGGSVSLHSHGGRESCALSSIERVHP